MTDYEQQLASKLEKAKRTRDKNMNKVTEELHDLILPLLEDKLVQALASGDSSVSTGQCSIDCLSTEAAIQLNELSKAGDLPVSGSKYIPSVFQPYLESFSVFLGYPDGELVFSFTFVIKD